MDYNNMVIIVTDRDGKTVASRVFLSSRYQSHDAYDRAIAKSIGHFERTYAGQGYRIHQGSAKDVASFLTVYPELARR